MTSLDVAPATSSPATRQPVPVIKRESLWKGGPIEIKIPAQCRQDTFEELVFIQFALKVNGGLVNMFVHDNDPAQHIGKTIVAEVEVLRKEMQDGRSFVYVDLRPTAGKPEYELWVAPVPLQTKQPIVFRTPALKGEVAIMAVSPEATGDRQLDRLVSQGWKIQHQDAITVYLTKDDRQLQHARRKSK